MDDANSAADCTMPPSPAGSVNNDSNIEMQRVGTKPRGQLTALIPCWRHQSSRSPSTDSKGAADGPTARGQECPLHVGLWGHDQACLSNLGYYGAVSEQDLVRDFESRFSAAAEAPLPVVT